MDLDRLSALPQAFLHRMEDMLGDDFEPFLAAYEQPRTYGLRVNTAKISCEEFEQIVPEKVQNHPQAYPPSDEEKPEAELIIYLNP